jgi:hypothetical protein
MLEPGLEVLRRFSEGRSFSDGALEASEVASRVFRVEVN